MWNKFDELSDIRAQKYKATVKRLHFSHEFSLYKNLVKNLVISPLDYGKISGTSSIREKNSYKDNINFIPFKDESDYQV